MKTIPVKGEHPFTGIVTFLKKRYDEGASG